MSPAYIFFFILIIISIVSGTISDEHRPVNKSLEEDRLNQKLYTLESNITNRLMNYLDGKVSFLNENITEIIKQTLEAANKKVEERIIQTFNASLEASNKKVEKTMRQLDTMNEVINKLIAQMPCKEVSLNRANYESPSYSIHDSLFHGAVQRDSAGRLTHLETRVAVQADGILRIRLMDKESYSASDIQYDINFGWADNQDTYLDKHINGQISNQHTLTSDILSTTEYRAFYVRIDDGTLQFGKEGEPPLISDVDVSIGSVKYIQFHYYMGNGAKIRYDCPAPVKH